MSRVMYNGKRLIPAPLVSITKTYQKTGNGDIIGKLYTLNITGTIVAHMGSPDSSGTFWTASGYPADENIDSDSRLAAIFRKQEAIRDLFSKEGKAFEVQSSDGSQPLRCYPRIISIDFAEDIWYERCNYTISLECDELYPEQEDVFTEYISSATESWSIDTNEDPQGLGAPTTYALSHTISAVGKKFYDETGAQPKEPWEYARDFVHARLGFDSIIALSSGINNLPSYYNNWNHSRSEQIGKKEGSYSVTENWLLASGVATEDFTVTTISDVDSPYTKVSINGNITGFELRNSDMEIVTTKWENVQTKFGHIASGLAYLRAKAYSNENLNIEPLSTTVGRNPLRGTIDYTYDYDSRPMTFVSGVKSEVISINDNFGGELFASIFVLGRSRGPVLQDLNTKPANTRSINIELVVDPPSYGDRSVATMKDVMTQKKPSNNPKYSGDLYNVIYAANPAHNGFETVFQDPAQENWDFKNGRYSYSCTWTYE